MMKKPAVIPGRHQEGIVPSLQIRDLPPDIYEVLSLRAEREGRSLAQQAIVELRRAREVQRGERRRATLERVTERLGELGVRQLHAPPEKLLREDRRR